MSQQPATTSELEPIEDSLQVASERVDDIVPLVFARLFATRLELPAIFATEPGAAPRSGMGNMVNEVLRLILAEGTAATEAEAQSAVVFHVGWGLELRMYADVLDAVMATVATACGEAWTPVMAEAWRSRLDVVRAALSRQFAIMEAPSRTGAQAGIS